VTSKENNMVRISKKLIRNGFQSMTLTHQSPQWGPSLKHILVLWPWEPI